MLIAPLCTHKNTQQCTRNRKHLSSAFHSLLLAKQTESHIKDPHTCSENSWNVQSTAVNDMTLAYILGNNSGHVVCACVCWGLVGLVLQSHLKWQCQPTVHAHIKPNHHHKILGERHRRSCVSGVGKPWRVCVCTCVSDRNCVCVSVAWWAQWRALVGLAQPVTHTHLALRTSHTDRFVLAHSIQVVRPGGRGRKVCVPMCVCLRDNLGGGGGGSWWWEITRFRVL